MRKNYLAFCCRPSGPLAQEPVRELGYAASPCICPPGARAKMPSNSCACPKPDRLSRKGGIFGEVERGRRFADGLLRNGETFLSDAENGRSDAEMFLGHTDYLLNEEEHDLGSGEDILKDRDYNLHR